MFCRQVEDEAVRGVVHDETESLLFARRDSNLDVDTVNSKDWKHSVFGGGADLLIAKEVGEGIARACATASHVSSPRDLRTWNGEAWARYYIVFCCDRHDASTVEGFGCAAGRHKRQKSMAGIFPVIYVVGICEDIGRTCCAHKE